MSTRCRARVGDLRAAVRMMSAPDGDCAEPATGLARKRRLVAQLCRMLDPQPDPSVDPRVSGNGNGNGNGTGHAAADFHDRPGDGMSPRMRQTLNRLLAGDSEKEIAALFGLSRHTVHVYVKKLYRRFGVCSRGELFARFVTAPRSQR